MNIVKIGSENKGKLKKVSRFVHFLTHMFDYTVSHKKDTLYSCR